MTNSDLSQLLLLAILLLLSAFFSSAETAMTTVSSIRVKPLAQEGDKRANVLMKIKKNSAKMLSAILIGNNIVNILASSLATTLATKAFGSAGVGIATGIMTLLVLIFGEITPKNLATMHSLDLALSYSRIIWGLMCIMTPLIFVINHLSLGFMKLLHIRIEGSGHLITEQELRTLVDAGRKDGALENEEHKMINNVFDFGDSLVRDVMVPRVDMVCIAESDSYDTIREVFKQEKLTRLPVYREDKDHIVGIINVKDFMFIEDPTHYDIRDMYFEPYYTYENKRISELMIEMRERSMSLTIVLDEYGSVAGMVTLEDLLEELVGEIRDEYDADEAELIRKIRENEYLVEGALKLDDLNEALGLNLISEDFDSVGGYIIEKLDHLPTVGEKVVSENGDLLRVDKMTHKRIDKIHLFVHQEKIPDTSDTEQSETKN